MTDTSGTPTPAAAKKINVGGYANFYTGKSQEPALIAQSNPRGRIYIHGVDIEDRLEAQNFLIKREEQGISIRQGLRYYVDTTPPETLPQNVVDFAKGVGIVRCSYVLGYAINWILVKGAKKLIELKDRKPVDGTAGYSTQIARYEQVTGETSTNLHMIGGVKLNAPDIPQQQRKSGVAVKMELAPVTALNLRTPSVLVDLDGLHIRNSPKKHKGGKAGTANEFVGLGMCESYMNQFIEGTKHLAYIVSDFTQSTRSKAMSLVPKLEFKTEDIGKIEKSGTLAPQLIGSDEEDYLDATLVDVQLILPPAKTLWAGNMVGTTIGIKDNIIPMRVPAYEIHQLFEDML